MTALSRNLPPRATLLGAPARWVVTRARNSSRRVVGLTLTAVESPDPADPNATLAGVTFQAQAPRATRERPHGSMAGPGAARAQRTEQAARNIDAYAARPRLSRTERRRLRSRRRAARHNANRRTA